LGLKVIEEHYETLLGSHYTWMMGSLERCLADARAVLSPGSGLTLEFREQPRELAGQDAVFTVRADRDRIMQCVLHFEPGRIWVTDVVHEWNASAWQSKKSSYPKLRLTSDEIVRQAQAAGLTLKLSEIRAGKRILAFRS
jgi:hypothetical protein